MQKDEPTILWQTVIESPLLGDYDAGAAYQVDDLGAVWLPPALGLDFLLNPPVEVCLMLLADNIDIEQRIWMVLKEHEPEAKSHSKAS